MLGAVPIIPIAGMKLGKRCSVRRGTSHGELADSAAWVMAENRIAVLHRLSGRRRY